MDINSIVAALEMRAASEPFPLFPHLSHILSNLKKAKQWSIALPHPLNTVFKTLSQCLKMHNIYKTC